MISSFFFLSEERLRCTLTVVVEKPKLTPELPPLPQLHLKPEHWPKQPRRGTKKKSKDWMSPAAELAHCHKFSTACTPPHQIISILSFP